MIFCVLAFIAIYAAVLGVAEAIGYRSLDRKYFR